MTSARVNVNTAADNTIVAGVPGHVIRVLHYTLVPAGAVNCTWKSGATALDGPCAFTAGGGITTPFPPVLDGGGEYCHFETAAGENLVLNLDAAVQVGGHVVYRQARV